MACNAEGTAWEYRETCTGDKPCLNGSCRNPCSDAEANKSYEGCEYWATTLMNSQLSPDFVPAVVISNRNELAASVTIDRGGRQLATVSVAPNTTETVELPWIHELKQDAEDERTLSSANVPQGAYHLVSSMPVTVYQFNPLQYRLNRECRNGDADPTDRKCYSYSNDASLLLPVHVLTEHYMVMSRPALGLVTSVEDFMGYNSGEYTSLSPSVMAVVNPQSEPVEVTVKFSSPTQPGQGVPGYRAGQEGTFTIQPGGVLQLASEMAESCRADWFEPEGYPCLDGFSTCTYGYCNMTTHDLTGTEIDASAPVAVFGAHDCDFVPFNRWACDHLEEQLFPFETWGTSFVASQTKRERGEPDVWRILSGGDGNKVTFVPESVHRSVTLNRGEHVEFEAKGSFMVDADKPIMVGQFTVGQSYSNFGGSDLPPGDPSFSLVVPVQQYRASYNFLAPDTYDQSYVNITATTEAIDSLTLDGRPLANAVWEPVPGTEYETTRHRIAPGSHNLSSSSRKAFGITVYGYGQFTSYMYPGGLNLEPIAFW
jgi:hypothetical protein